MNDCCAFERETGIDAGLAGVGFLGWVSGRFLCRLRALVSPLPGESLSLVWPRERDQREGHPFIRPCAARRVRSLHRRSEGRRTRSIPGPLRLKRPSRPLAPLRNDSVRPPQGAFGAACKALWVKHKSLRAKKQRKKRSDNSEPSPRQEAEWRCRAGGRAAGMRREA